MIDKTKYTKKQLKEIIDSVSVIIDTREQQPYAVIEWLNNANKQYKIQKLDYGDYSFYIPDNEELGIIGDIDFDDELVFERKNSINEIVGNFVDRKRIEGEFANKVAEMYLLIEGTYDDMASGNYRSNFPKSSAIATFHSFIDRYDLKPIFISRSRTPEFMYNTFKYHLRNKLK